MSHQESIAPEQQQQQAEDLEARIRDPEVVPKAKRRQFGNGRGWLHRNVGARPKARGLRNWLSYSARTSDCVLSSSKQS